MDNLSSIFAGEKPLGNFEQRKHADDYDFIARNFDSIADYFEVIWWNGPEGPEFIIAQEGRRADILAFVDIIGSDIPWLERQLRLGRLLGYDDASIADWLTYVIGWERTTGVTFCDCSKCQGAAFLADFLKREA
jgi:hypothetical protein